MSGDKCEESATGPSKTSSGIRPPSRIGRPCAGNQQKPPIPTSPNKKDNVRRMTDNFGRHKLCDLLETDENEDDTLGYLRRSPQRKRYTSTGSTASSIDALWDLHPGRLSEAGLSRHSDSSTILTEDTDSFIIGERVWVGGTKPGKIAFIGETQFAPGEWAGIALDEPIGKNDGSVAGIRYFQCEDKKGVFSRLTRLTRVPLASDIAGSNETFVMSTPSPSNGTVRRSPISPTGSTRGLMRVPVSLTNSNTSLASTTTHHIDFKIGDRVIVKSSQGSKVGTARYIGITDFAPGEWVGVELDDPRGKNDGSVDGKRYFECRPNFGLFASASKVSKSPSKYKPGACAIHSSGAALPPSGLRRANSKESMTSYVSINSTATSGVRRVRLGVTSLTPKKVTSTPRPTPTIPTRSALQDALKDKQQQIEQLLKERELERAQTTKAATQADEAEQKLVNIRLEFEQYRSECEIKLIGHTNTTEELKKTLNEIQNRLDDEKRKNEDLQFRYEEIAITKTDVEEKLKKVNEINEKNLLKIKTLEKLLNETRENLEKSEHSSDKLFETEENLMKTREELESLKNNANKERESWENERKTLTETINALKKQLENSQENLKQIDVLKSELMKIQSEKKILQEQLDQIKNESINNETTTQIKNNEIVQLNDELEKNKRLLKENLDNLEQTFREKTFLNKEIEKLKMDISSKILDLETMNEKLMNGEKQIDELNRELIDLKTNNELNENKLNDKHIKVIEERDKKILEITEKLNEKTREIEKTTSDTNQLKNELENKNGIINKLQTEIGDLKKLFETNLEETVKLKDLQGKLQLENGDNQRKLQDFEKNIGELIEEKSKLQNELQIITTNSGDHNVRIEQLTLQLQEKDVYTEKLRVEMKEKLDKSEHIRQEIEMKHNNLQEKFQLNKQQLEETFAKIGEIEESNRKHHEDTLNGHRQQLEELTKKTHDLQKIVAEKDEILKKNSEKMQENEEKLREQQENLKKLYEDQKLAGNYKQEFDELKIINGDLQRKLENSQKNLNELQEGKSLLENELETMKISAKENLHLIEELKNKLKEFELNAGQLEKNTQTNLEKYQHQNRELENKLNELNSKYHEESEKNQELIKEMEIIKIQHQEQLGSLKEKEENILEINNKLKEKSDLLQTIQNKLNTLQNDCNKSNVNLNEKDNKISSLNCEIQEKNDCLNNLSLTIKEQQDNINNYLTIINLLELTTNQKSNFSKKIKDKNSESKLLEIMKNINTTDTDENSQKILDIQNELENTKKQLNDLNNIKEIQSCEILRLQNELAKMKTSLATIPEQNDISFEDQETTQSQIRFLNSIIVDMKQKNDEYKNRIELLESGYNPSMIDDFKLFGVPERDTAPRLYCDICEEFDQHETEDCPKQDSDAPVLRNHDKPKKTPPLERPYCDLCEVFGHATEDCEDNLTF